MKAKLCAIFAIFVLAGSLFAGCGNNVKNPDDSVTGAENVNRRHDNRYGVDHRTTHRYDATNVHGRYDDINGVNRRDNHHYVTNVHGRYDEVNKRNNRMVRDDRIARDDRVVRDNRNVNKNHRVTTHTNGVHKVHDRTAIAVR